MMTIFLIIFAMARSSNAAAIIHPSAYTLSRLSGYKTRAFYHDFSKSSKCISWPVESRHFTLFRLQWLKEKLMDIVSAFLSPPCSRTKCIFRTIFFAEENMSHYLRDFLIATTMVAFHVLDSGKKSDRQNTRSAHSVQSWHISTEDQDYEAIMT